MPAKRRQGTLHGGMPFLCFGAGEPLVILAGLSADHKPPRGSDRRFQARLMEPFATHRRVWWVNRRPGLAPDAAMADLAHDYAEALRRKFGEPVDIMGISTGGQVALQLASDHPDVVRRLVIVSAAYRLGRRGRGALRHAAEALQASRPRQAGAALMAMVGAGPAEERVLRVLGWVFGKAMFGRATPDAIATIRAQATVDLRERLHDITAPTLVIGGDRDAFFGEELFTETAALIPDSQLILHEGQGHMGTFADPELASEVIGFLDTLTRARRPPP